MKKSPFERLALRTAAESFIAFLAAGFFLVVGGGFFVDLSGDLPEWYLQLVQEPISLFYFFILSISSLMVAAFVTWGGTRDVSRAWWFEWLVLAPNRAGICCGSIASGMLLGIGAGLTVVTLGAPESDLASTALVFFGLGVWCLVVAFPVALLMSYLIDPEQRHRLIIDVLGGLYIVLIVVAAFKHVEHIDLIGVGLGFAIFIFWVLIGRWLYTTKIANTATEPTR